MDIKKELLATQDHSICNESLLYHFVETLLTCRFVSSLDMLTFLDSSNTPATLCGEFLELFVQDLCLNADLFQHSFMLDMDQFDALLTMVDPQIARKETSF